jgi:hypothetical protein
VGGNKISCPAGRILFNATLRAIQSAARPAGRNEWFDHAGRGDSARTAAMDCNWLTCCQQCWRSPSTIRVVCVDFADFAEFYGNSG